MDELRVQEASEVDVFGRRRQREAAEQVWVGRHRGGESVAQQEGPGIADVAVEIGKGIEK